ncbi:MAG TPA: exonuclease domain-containing protein [bacterium]|nr:exonuclease domain-containing protein [bacterium]
MEAIRRRCGGFPCPFIVVDIETTGGKPEYSRIIELSAFKVQNGAISDSTSSLVNPRMRIPSWITELTGITNSDVSKSPYIENILPDFIDFLGDGIFTAHPVSFDLNFINHELSRSGMAQIQNDSLCTVRLSRRVYHKERSHSLDHMIPFLHLDMDPADRHRGYGDAWATSELLLRCMSILRSSGLRTFDDLIYFSYLNKADSARMLELTDET